MTANANILIETMEHKRMANELSRHLNVLLAFEENVRDELELENTIRRISETLALRHINHVIKLSKSGSKQLAEGLFLPVSLYDELHSNL